MIKIKDLDIKSKIVVGVIIALMLLTVVMYVVKSNDNNMEEIEAKNEEILEEVKEKNQIIVHVTGQVKNSGVVSLEEGARVVDAIEAGGGETDEADLSSLNLAYMLSDGEKIYVPNKEETSQESQEREYITSAKDNSEQSENGAKSTGTNFKININTAKQEELTQITGIGESTAKKIIEYRTQNGKFKSIEDIKNIPGIGDSKFNAMKEEITVN